MKKIIIILLLVILYTFGFSLLTQLEGNNLDRVLRDNVSMLLTEEAWAENRLKNMSLEEKIAQLMMIRIHSNFSKEYQNNMVEEIEKYQPGGVCFFQGGPIREITLTNRIQAVSKIPLLVGIDGEWGPAMRVDSCHIFPRQMTMGAMDPQDDSLIYQMGCEVAKQCKAMGIHINFAPCVDVNNNRNNPVINSRSFGENRDFVAQKAIAYMQGMQDNGVSACAKHFPGHGDTGTDSHSSLPTIKKTRQELDSMELFPFRKIINAGVDMVMVSHLNVPALDPARNSIATLSYPIITELLQKDMAFDGIIVTDAMDMNGLRSHYPRVGDGEIKALLAGVDVLLLPGALSTVIPAIKNAVENGTIPEELIDEKCLKVLKFKYGKGLKHVKPLSTKDIYDKTNSASARKISAEIEAKSLTLLKNEDGILPLSTKEAGKVALLCIGGIRDSAQYHQLCNQYGIGYVHTDRSIKKAKYPVLLNQLAPYSKVIIAMLSTNQLPNYHYGIYQESVSFIQEVLKSKDVILSVGANPYSLTRFGSFAKYKALIVSYQATPTTVAGVLAAVFGKASFSGRLPVATPAFKLQEGIQLHSLNDPNGFSTLTAAADRKIDSLMNNGIKNTIFPGAQVIAIHKGKVVYHKNFGHNTYEPTYPVTDGTIYDIASMTKSAATTLAVMKLYEEGKIKLTDKIGTYLPFLKGSNKENLTLAELLTHTSGLPAFIPFYKKMLTNNNWDPAWLRPEKGGPFTIEIAKDVYMHQGFPAAVKKEIANCKLGAKTYVYSDLGFVLLKEMVESLTGTTMDKYLEQHFYRPLKMNHTCFNPYRTVNINTIAPTENDRTFRKQVVQGYVHDQTAAVFGGVCGNAGLFSNVSDLAILFQMLMNGGTYNGITFFKKETVQLFTSTYVLHGCQRRGLGFDTPSHEKKSSILPAAASKKTFGHQGFTGTVFWCDPDNDLIYIFLSNRVYPDAEPNKLSKSGIRLHVHRAVYEGLGIK